MSEMMGACIACGRMKAVDGFSFCGGAYCLYDSEAPTDDWGGGEEAPPPDADPLDQLLDEQWAADGNEPTDE